MVYERAYSTTNSYQPAVVARVSVWKWHKRSIAAFMFAGGEGWDTVRNLLNLTNKDELWLERWRS